MEKRDKIIWIVTLSVLTVICLTSYLWRKSGENKAENFAMYVPGRQDAFLMIDQGDEGAFSMTMPEELYDINGNKITVEQLRAGNILKLTGDGIMLVTYPGQYPGVVKAEVVKEGTPADTEPYQEILDEFCPEPDPAEPPGLHAEYTYRRAATGVSIARGSYRWSYEDKEGNPQTAGTEMGHVLQWDVITEIEAKRNLKLKLIFSETPMKAETCCWPLEVMEKDSGNTPEAEEVPLEKSGEDFIIPKAKKGYVYEVTGIWERGEVSYGFVIKEQ